MVANNPKYLTPPRPKIKHTLPDLLNPFSEKAKLARAWSKRNVQFGEVYLHAMMINPENVIIFQQNIFIKHDADLNIELNKRQFQNLKGFPDEKLFEKFCEIKWNKKFNVAFSLVDRDLFTTVKTANEIATNKTVSGDALTSLNIFLTTIEILINKKNDVYND